MRVDQPIDQLIAAVQALDRKGCVRQLRQLDRPLLDFTDEFLEGQSLDQLRHLVFAACVQARKSAPTTPRAT